MARNSILSTAEVRRPVVAAAALAEFARGGYHGTTVADVARSAGISPAYVFKLFPRKEALFVTALETCFDQILTALADGADRASETTPRIVLDAMGDAYSALIRDRTLLLLQVHAQSVTDIVEIGAALRAGVARVTNFVKSRSAASDDDVQTFMAFGQLCHLLVTARIDDVDAEWAAILSRGMHHPA